MKLNWPPDQSDLPTGRRPIPAAGHNFETMKNIYEQINEKIAGLLTEQLKGYQKQWINVKIEPFARNPHTKHWYSMINTFLMHIALYNKTGYYLNRWITFLQAQEIGARIKKGSTADVIVFTSAMYKDENGSNVTKRAEAMQAAGAKIPANWQKISFLKGYNVFNVADVEGLPEDYLIPMQVIITPKDRIKTIDSIISRTGARINETATNQPCYYPGRDVINMPNMWQFEAPESFYGVLFHELGHWTGHPNRLNRQMTQKQQDYAFEELVAELTSAYCCARLNLAGEVTNNAAYLKNWLQGLNDDLRFFTHAAGLAQKAADFILGTAEQEERRAA